MVRNFCRLLQPPPTTLSPLLALVPVVPVVGMLVNALATKPPPVDLGKICLSKYLPYFYANYYKSAGYNCEECDPIFIKNRDTNNTARDQEEYQKEFGDKNLVIVSKFSKKNISYFDF